MTISILRESPDIEEQSIHIEAYASLLAKSIFYYVHSVGHYHVKPTFCVEQANIDSFLLAYTESGVGYLDYAGHSYTLRAGDVFLIDCRQPHTYRTNETNLWKLMWVHFEGGSTSGYYKQINKHTGPVISLQQDSFIPENLRKLITAIQSNDARSPIISSKIIVDLLTDLLLQSNCFDWSYPEPPPSIERIVKKMQTHCKEKITLDQLAEEFFISKYHLTREFKRYTGHSPIEYHMKLKIAAAKDLLRTTALSIVEIGSEIGFSSVNHFIGRFKKHEGMTPLAYRKRSRCVDD
ncbi:AraC family transcriptional regulator [Paenibacillus spongiae]|uniref:AraC family transcriptional regulator n=1 Tax=Paenibacillus spongiae TaxID=2909671 RepID=A0ABY5S552_9BACL|nr:AraC family transcriptional regulator [Paenibacillus spongiae]UVI27970.1 AraC family transcriptional regulator [Paenibacillus spongiae]